MRLRTPLCVAALLALSSCSAPDGPGTTVLTGPDPSPFAAATGGVGPVFERRCGSLDCHGSTARALRIYSANGLRLGTTLGPGGGLTTTDETSANYLSVISIEPEKTTAVAKGGDPYSLLILKKPLLIERHKGGPALIRDDDAEKCISSWLRGSVDRGACTAGAALP